MNRAELQQLATDRIEDARILLDEGRWSGAYYLAGYAVECGLKSCILRYVESTPEIIFQARNFSVNCWKHQADELIPQANLQAELDATIEANPEFAGNWGTVQGWSEDSRYEQRTEIEAKELYEAITHDPDGVLPWIRKHW